MSTTPGSAVAHADNDTDIVGRKSHFDPAAGATAIWIFQGDFYVSSRPDLFLTAVLGSCIAVCIRDPAAGCGGMNHFLLPDSENRDDHYPSQALRYGSYSIERLINAILSRGGRRERLEVKVFGGANVMSGMSDVGARNVDFVEHYFANERLPIAAADLRGTWPRKLRYFPTLGIAQVRELRDAEADEAIKAEEILRSRISVSKHAGDVEVFK
ncbi:MAG: chemoreceptor glutamine deamidase CheD [Rhizobiales bacterium]|nr:chemoreceptor glutamine deamidase CheD [Hyphomicrobiales bacterium]